MWIFEEIKWIHFSVKCSSVRSSKNLTTFTLISRFTSTPYSHLVLLIILDF